MNRQTRRLGTHFPHLSNVKNPDIPGLFYIIASA
ncbi:hypothetical protein CLV92_102191 [Kineococcus xinjiangensis]|uniref:Uncharacterized protein n=1 Tax=Kineococcus xinjiangensis TaxID=512762 RepID=A0A2S6IV03_9ACTN|nr:hypothetical protein CLV92_102191 [Kineococcus xinjiangensis]